MSYLPALARRPLARLALLSAALLTGCSSGGGAHGDGGVDAASCPVGQVTFVLRQASGVPGNYCVGGPNSCSRGWLSITRPDSSSIEIDRPCEADCHVCQAVGCPAFCTVPTALVPAGEQRTWDGTSYLESRCGAALMCTSSTCAPRGRYTAKMCAYAAMASPAIPGGLCSSVETPTCVSIDFDWPPLDGQSTVSGTLGATTDGGADGGEPCCPASFTLYSCSYADGGAGQACHNPALGCASSTTCGDGCDQVVSGRCGAS